MMNKRQNATESNQSSSQNSGEIYEIRIKEFLDDHWQQWFEGMTLRKQEDAEAEQDSTLIIGLIADQPALHGLLAKIRDLNLTLISVRKLDLKEPCDQESSQNDANTEPSRKEHP